MGNDVLKNKLKGLEKLVKTMKPKHYAIQSEYHRLMYGYHLQIETIKKSIEALNKE